LVGGRPAGGQRGGGGGEARLVEAELVEQRAGLGIDRDHRGRW
jgi:hypothetical protein